MNEKDIEIEITNDGTCVAIWDDDNPLQRLGDVQVIRLSDVEWNGYGWMVKFRNGHVLPRTYKRRVGALNAEITYVARHLTEFGEWVKGQIKETQSLKPNLTGWSDPCMA